MTELPRFKGTRRGIFGLSTWTLQPKPSESFLGSQVPAESVVKADVLMQQTVSLSPKTNISQRRENGDVPGASLLSNRSLPDKGFTSNTAMANVDATKEGAKKPPSAPTVGQRLVAKFSYNANVDSPLGKNAEISLRTMDKMTMLGPHKQQEYWWLVRMDDGREGYVPANYVTPFEEKISSLPWLANKCVEPLPEISSVEKSTYKPYKSAYDKDEKSSTVNTNWFCEVCQKSFNGPKPYSAHMSSRAHRDELEAQAAY